VSVPTFARWIKRDQQRGNFFVLCVCLLIVPSVSTQEKAAASGPPVSRVDPLRVAPSRPPRAEVEKSPVFRLREEFYRDWSAGKIRDEEPPTHPIDEAHAGKDKADPAAGKKLRPTDDGTYVRFKRWEWYALTHMDASGRLPDIEHLQKEWKKFQIKKAGAPRNIFVIWESLGPYGTPDDNNGSVAGTGVGRVTSIAFGKDRSTIFIGTPDSGVWKTTDGGKQWFHMTEGLLPHAVQSLASDPAHHRVYMGCMQLGEGDWSSGADSRNSLGVYWSKDDGVTWEDRNGVGSTLKGLSIRRLRIDPKNTETIFAATSQGVARSVDAGKNWTFVALGFDAGDVEINPANSMIVYASSYRGAGRILRSTTGGTTGSFHSFEMGISSPSTKLSRIELAISPANPDILYAMCADKTNTTFAALFRTTHARDNANPVSPAHGWHNRAAGYFLGSALPITGLVGTQARSNFALAVSPTDANRIYVGGLDFIGSEDGGTTFGELGEANPILGHYIHADQWAIAFPPGGDGQVLFVANDGGIWKSTSSGGGIEYINGTLANMTMYRIAVDPNHDTKTFAGAQDNGINRYEPNIHGGGANAWVAEVGNDGMTCLVNPIHSRFVYAMNQFGKLQIAADGGVGFHERTPAGAKNADGTIGGLWITPMTFSETLQRVYFGYDRVFSDPADTDDEPKPISGPIFNGIINAMAVSADGKTMYASTIDDHGNGILFTGDLKDGGRKIGTWWYMADSGAFALPGVPITGIVTHPTDPQIVYLCLGGNGGVFKSVNGGHTFTNISGSLPQVSVNTIAFDTTHPERDGLYIGTDFGVLYRDSTMTDWEVYDWAGNGAGLPNTQVMDLAVHARTHVLRAGTFGRGLYQVPLYKPLGGARYYPPSFGRKSSDYWIDEVKVGTERGPFDNKSGDNNGYGDFRAAGDLHFKKGGKYQATLTRGIGYVSEYPSPKWRVWIDLNHDGEFDDKTERVADALGDPSSGNQTSTVTLKIPFEAATGRTRMRIAMLESDNGEPSPSKIFDVGEVEDYSVVLSDCVGVGVVSASNVTDHSARLGWSMLKPEHDSGFRIRYRLQGAADWTVDRNPTLARNASDPTWVFYHYTLDGLLADRVYEVQVRTVCDQDPEASSETEWSNTLLVHTLASSGPYCPSHGSPVQGGGGLSSWISRVKLRSGGTMLMDRDSSDEIAAYSFFGKDPLGNPQATLDAGQTIHFDLTAEQLVPPDWAHPSRVWRIWIDFDQNDKFDDPAELVYDSGSFAVSLEASGKFQIPGTAKAGTTRLRISMKAATPGDPADAVAPGPCAVFATGEVEDYTIIIRQTISPPGVPLHTPKTEP
jgi:photosystem II stability/assembly factor-like uncharacterized protein